MCHMGACATAARQSKAASPVPDGPSASSRLGVQQHLRAACAVPTDIGMSDGGKVHSVSAMQAIVPTVEAQACDALTGPALRPRGDLQGPGRRKVCTLVACNARKARPSCRAGQGPSRLPSPDTAAFAHCWTHAVQARCRCQAAAGSRAGAALTAALHFSSCTRSLPCGTSATRRRSACNMAPRQACHSQAQAEALHAVPMCPHTVACASTCSPAQKGWPCAQHSCRA
jgi:hypothetical protein